MVVAVKIVGIVFIAAGILYILKPDVLKRLIEFFKKGPRMYVAGLIRFALAVVFLVGAGDCREKWVIAGFGIIFLISGLLVLMLGPRRLRGMLEWFQKQPAMLIRIVGVIALAIGAVIAYSA